MKIQSETTTLISVVYNKDSGLACCVTIDTAVYFSTTLDIAPTVVRRACCARPQLTPVLTAQ